MTVPDRLRPILDSTRRRLRESPPDQGSLERGLEQAPPAADALASLRQAGMSLISEIKRRSPSEGALRTVQRPGDVAASYEAAGARAISVLTEPDFFGGALDDLREVRERVSVPCLRKDFIVDPIQILEARHAGASMILLIVAALKDQELVNLREFTQRLGMEALVEAHTEEEVARAIGSGARIVGINNRDLVSFHVDLAVAQRLRPLIPSGVISVAESGIVTPDDLGLMMEADFDAALVGSSLMRAEDPAEALRALVSRGQA